MDTVAFTWAIYRYTICGIDVSTAKVWHHLNRVLDKLSTRFDKCSWILGFRQFDVNPFSHSTLSHNLGCRLWILGYRFKNNRGFAAQNYDLAYCDLHHARLSRIFGKTRDSPLGSHWCLHYLPSSNRACLECWAIPLQASQYKAIIPLTWFPLDRKPHHNPEWRQRSNPFAYIEVFRP